MVFYLKCVGSVWGPFGCHFWSKRTKFIVMFICICLSVCLLQIVTMCELQNKGIYTMFEIYSEFIMYRKPAIKSLHLLFGPKWICTVPNNSAALAFSRDCDHKVKFNLFVFSWPKGLTWVFLTSIKNSYRRLEHHSIILRVILSLPRVSNKGTCTRFRPGDVVVHMSSSFKLYTA